MLSTMISRLPEVLNIGLGTMFIIAVAVFASSIAFLAFWLGRDTYNSKMERENRELRDRVMHLEDSLSTSHAMYKELYESEAVLHAGSIRVYGQALSRTSGFMISQAFAAAADRAELLDVINRLSEEIAYLRATQTPMSVVLMSHRNW